MRESRAEPGKNLQGNAAGRPSESGRARQDDGLQADERNIGNQLAIEKQRKDTKDVLLNEAVHILSDAVGALKSNAGLAARVRAGSLPMPQY